MNTMNTNAMATNGKKTSAPRAPRRLRFAASALLVALLLALVPACQSAVDPGPLVPQSDGDVYLMFQGEVFDAASGLLPAEVVGELAYDLQEGAHERITDVSGAEIDYYYIWVCLGSDCIPVDPFRFGN